ncbi:MAG: protein kinase, partial [Acetobacteraceae bacterium]|nr:protein kinase [Acetobacteraceae bacterium]
MSGQAIPPGLTAKYEIRGTLGAGAMGVVYDAWDRLIERRVAIKVVRRPGGNDPDAIEAHARFRREAQAAGRLQHPNIVAVYDYGEDETAAWIVMELVEGGSLKKRLDAKERFPIAEIVRVMTQVLEALDYSHKRGVVHRDIKPANVMLGEGGQVKLADFGIARIENSSMTQVGTVMGTPSYMAPEQLRGEPVDLRADIWAAGVLLYQLLTGAKPFEGDFVALSHRVLHTEPPPPSALSVTCPRAFDAVVAKALAKRPEDRYPSAAAFAEAIRAAASGAQASAAPPRTGDADATMVAAKPSAPPAEAPAAGPAARRGGPPWALIGGGLAAAGIAAAAAVFVMQPAPPPPPPQPATTTALRLEAETPQQGATASQPQPATLTPPQPTGVTPPQPTGVTPPQPTDVTPPQPTGVTPPQPT